MIGVGANKKSLRSSESLDLKEKKKCMKKIYLKPLMKAVKIELELMQFTSSEQETAPVDPGKPKDPDDAMSRKGQAFSLWDDE
jgi:hypothetical protein